MKSAYIPLGCDQQGRITPTKFPAIGVASTARTRFSRSSADAFPAERSCAIEVYRSPWRIRGALYAIVCVAACVVIGAIFAVGA